MSNIIKQGELNRRQVVVEQMTDAVLAAAREWKALGRRDQLAIWKEWLETSPAMRPFNRFHRVLQVIEEVR